MDGKYVHCSSRGSSRGSSIPGSSNEVAKNFEWKLMILLIVISSCNRESNYTILY